MTEINSKDYEDFPLKLPRTDIIVVTYNAKQKLIRCLRSVLRHTRNVPYQLTVIDNASTDGTSEYLKKHFSKNIRLIQSSHNLGFSGGANSALRQTNGPWVVLLDDDVEVTPGWLSKLHALAKKDPKTGIVSGKVVFPDGRIFCAEVSLVPFGPVGLDEMDRGQRDYIKETDALPGPCWLLPRRVIEKVGDFDENFFPSQYEDVDYCIRVRRAGYKIFYHGQVKILHHHLFRTDSSGSADANKLEFFRKWHKVLPRFPMSPLTAGDHLIVQGAKIFQKETFCPRDEIFGKWSQLTPWFTESFYRGIALEAAGNSRKAAREFRKVSAKCQTRSFSRNPETTVLRYILSVYFSKMGMQDEAAKQTALIMKLMTASVRRGALPEDEFESSPKEIALHRWRIQFITHDQTYLNVLERLLPAYWNRVPEKPAARQQANEILKISFFNRIRQNWDFDFFSGQGLIHSHSRECGIYRSLDQRKNRVVVVMNQQKYFKDNWIFHGGFLGPLNFLLRSQEASLVHGALLQKNGKGLLILGETGAGKSTISTVCLNQNFRFFSDEHPILELKDGRIQGKSLAALIALPALSVKKNFAHLQNQMEWSTDRQKYLLNPERVWPGCTGESSEISRIIFPEFKLNGNLSVKRLGADLFLKRLLKDEYLRVLLSNEYETPEKSVPRRIAACLSKTTHGYIVEYGPKDIDRLPFLLEKEKL